VGDSKTGPSSRAVSTGLSVAWIGEHLHIHFLLLLGSLIWYNTMVGNLGTPLDPALVLAVAWMINNDEFTAILGRVIAFISGKSELRA
jgi:hypothetical protein